jgi:hypothetical protein
MTPVDVWIAMAVSAVAATPLTTANDSSAAARRRAQTSRHRVPMNGACAAVARSNVWTKDPSDKELDPETGELREVGGQKKVAQRLEPIASGSSWPART